MSIIKFAEVQVHPEIHDPKDPNSSFENMLLDSTAAHLDVNARERFVKFANALRKVAPKAKDFLYFSCIMMHSAEASLIDSATGDLKKSADGHDLSCKWHVDKKSGSWKWDCNDANIKPYKNNNGDIFPETELKKAYRKWVGRPLCKDHQSSSVDGIRGIIVDTYYDDKYKRVIALCALDKVNYPDLARKVSTGYATNVSMGTAVGQSICFECGNIAKIEADYCPCVKNRSTYGEINIDLSPIELSLVVTGADPMAKLRNVIAGLNQYSEEKQGRIEELKQAGCVTPGELDRLEKEVKQLRTALQSVTVQKEAVSAERVEQARHLGELLKTITDEQRRNKLEAMISDMLGLDEQQEPVSAASDTEQVIPPYGMAGNKEMTGGKGGIGADPESSGPPSFTFENRKNVNVLGSDLNVNLEVKKINAKLDTMELALRNLAEGVHKSASTNKEEQIMSDAKSLEERARARRAMFKQAYHQGGGGVNDPQTYPVDPLNDKLKTDGDKQMEGQGMESGSDGMHPGYQSYGSEEALKKKLSRADLEQRKLRRHALLRNANQWNEIATTSDGRKVLENATTKETKVLKADDAAAFLASDGQNTASVKHAYHQGGGGVNDPQTYPVDPLNDKLKTDGDKQMEGQGMESGNDGMHPGYQSYGNEEALKKKHLRADKKLRAKFVLAFQDENKTVPNKERSRWEIYSGSNKILTATGKEIFEDELEANWETLASKRYGREVLRAIREQGFERVGFLLKGEGFVKNAQPPVAAPPAPPAPGGDMPPMGPEMGAPGAELGEEDDAGAATKDPVDAAADALGEGLAAAEKALGDLTDALEESTGDTEAELPSPAAADADDDKEEDDDKCKECASDSCNCSDAADADDAEAGAAVAIASRIGEVYAALNESADELAMLAESIDTRVKAGAGKDDAVVAELLALTKEALAENAELRSEATLISEAAKKDDDKKDDKKSKGGKKGKLPPWLDKKKSDKDDKKESKKSDKDDKKESKKSDKDDKDEKKSKAEQMLARILKARATKRRDLIRQAEYLDMPALDDDDDEDLDLEGLEEELEGLEEEVDELQEMESEEPWHDVEEDDEDDVDDLEAQLAQLLDEPVEGFDADDFVAEADDEDEEADADDLEVTAEDRRAWRAKVAAEVGAKYQLKLDPETAVDTDMPLPQSTQLGQLSISPSDDGAKVEGLVEKHQKIMQQVHNLPKVREAMERLVTLMKVGALGEGDFNNAEKLKALAVDPAAVKYWKSYFSQADKESSQFATELTKEYSKKKTAASLENSKLKMRRAYDLALQMQDKSMIPDGPEYLHKQVDEIMQFDDKSFESVKRAMSRINVSKTAQVKTAAPALQVGVNDDGLGSGTSGEPVNLVSQLRKMWS